MATVKECEQRINELSRLIDQLGKQDSVSQETVANLSRVVEHVRDQFEPVHRDWSKTQDRLDKLEKAGDQWSARIWDAAKLLLAAAGGGVVTYLVKR